jgi:hypothetical protein
MSDEIRESHSLNRNFQNIVVAAALGIGGWLLYGMNDIQKTMVRVDTTLTAYVTKADTTDAAVRMNASDIRDLDNRLRDLEMERASGRNPRRSIRQ